MDSDSKGAPATWDDAKFVSTTSKTPKHIEKPEIDFETVHKIIVGSEQRQFFVPAYFLTKTSRFFEAALRWQKDHGGSKEIKLPELSVTHFKLYLKWAYTGKFTLGQTSADEKRVDAAGRTPVDKLIGLWLLGDSLEDVTFRDIVIRAIYIKWHSEDISKEDLNGVVHETSDYSTLRKICVDMFVNGFEGDSEPHLSDFHGLTQDTLAVMVSRMIYIQGSNDWLSMEEYTEQPSNASLEEHEAELQNTGDDAVHGDSASSEW